MQLNELQREVQLLQQDKESILNCMDKIRDRIARIRKMDENKWFLSSVIKKIAMWFWEQDYYSFRLDLCECDDEIWCINRKIDKIT